MTVTKISLDQLLTKPDLDRTVTWAPEGSVGWNEFLTRVKGLSDRLEREDNQRWTLVAENSYAFLVGLLAAWHSGGIAVLPPNTEPEMVKGIATETGSIITDVEELESFAAISVNPLSYEANPGSLGEIDPERTTTEMMTSGSTGERKVVRKNLGHIWSDVRYYDQMWEDIVGNSIVFSNISHQHIFGLYFKVLWPLVEGRAFYPETTLFPGDLSSMLEEVSEAYLVTSPSPLERLVRSGELETARDTLTAIFSGGGRIEDELAEKIHDQLGFYPFSVFGSTECGGIAGRVRDPNQDESGLKPFPGVNFKISENGELFVKSATVSEGNQEWYPTGDLAEQVGDEEFVLKGRADRVVKIADNRVSLPQIETRLETSGYVTEAVASIVNESGDGSRKTEVGAAVELSQSGQGFLRDRTEDDLRVELRDQLKGFVEDVAIPREWRFLEELPRDHMSKVSQEKIQELFE